MAKTRVLFILEDLAGGGAEAVVVHLLNRLSRRRFRADLLLLRSEGDYFGRLADDVGLHLPARSRRHIQRHLPRHCREVFRVAKAYDVLVGGTELIPSYLACVCGRARGKRVVSMVHVALRPYLRLLRSQSPVCGAHRLLTRAMFPRFDRIVAVSRGAAADLRRIAPVDEARLVTIPNPIDVNFIVRRGAEPLPPWAEPLFRRRAVVSAGRLSWEKGFDVLIRAHALLTRRGLRQELIVLGRGPLGADLAALARDLKVADTVHFPGFVDNPFALLARADVVCVPSRFEGFSLVVAEALCLAAPVVAADCPFGPAEILAGGAWGLLVPPGDPRALAAAIARVLSDADLARRLAREGPRRAADFALDRIVPQYEELLGGL